MVHQNWTTMSLEAVFERARNDKRAVFIGYFPVGFPTVEDSIRIMQAMVDGGVEILEIGWPYSDPLMDGPTIQKATDIALKHGVTSNDVFNAVASVVNAGAEAAVMSYWNLIERLGVETFTQQLKRAGGAGTITPDLTPDEAAPWLEATDAALLDRIFLIAPASSDERIKLVSQSSRGFLYAASLMGVTGERASLSSEAEKLVTRARALTDMPIAVGLGISSAENVKEVAAYADGVIVGSAFVRIVLNSSSIDEAIVQIRSLARDMREATYK
jgi:tryptophan synthase alpha chain